MNSSSKGKPPYIPPKLSNITPEASLQKLAAANVRCVFVLTTGGTMEKVYSEQTGSVANVDSKIDRYLRLLRISDCEVNGVP